jgi:hypothetical protein
MVQIISLFMAIISLNSLIPLDSLRILPSKSFLKTFFSLSATSTAPKPIQTAILNLPICKKVILKSRPEKVPLKEDFEMIYETARTPEEGEVLIEVKALSIDAFIRTTLSEDAFHKDTGGGIGNVVTALGMGKVLISRSKLYKKGDMVSGFMGAQTHNTMAATAFQKVLIPGLDLPVQLGLLGIAGNSNSSPNPNDFPRPRPNPKSRPKPKPF